MKDEREHIDDVFKDVAEKQSFNIPDSFLKDLDGRLHKVERKMKRRGLWWLVFLPIGICAFLYYSSVSNNKTSKNATNIDQEITEKIVSNEENIDSVFSTDAEKTEKNPVSNDLDGRVNDEALSSPPVINGKIKEGQSTSMESSAVSVSNASNIYKENKAPNENLTSKEIDPEINDGKAMALETVSAGELISLKSSSVVDRSNEDKSTIDEMYKAIDSSAASSDGSAANINNIDSTDQMITIDNTSELLAMDTLTQIDSIVAMKSEDTQFNTLESEGKAKKWAHEIQLYAGMVNSSPLLGFASDNASEQMIANELSLWTASYGIKYHSSLNDFDLGIGFEVIKNGEKVNYSPNSFNEFAIDSTYFVGFEIDSILNNNQVWEIDSIPVYADTSYIVTIMDTNSFNGKNMYSWINIPLNFGYRFELGEYGLIPRIGIDLGFASGVNIGTYAETTGGGFVQRSSNRFILAYSLQLEIRRSFNHFHVFINPYFRSNVMPVVSSDIQRRRYHSMGLNAGIGFMLNP